jgi:tripartite-type tricarboxylate transporter receptor subunit TctC
MPPFTQRIPRRALLAAPALLAPLLAPLVVGVVASPAAALEFTRDVRLLIPYAPGGSVDIIGRMLAELVNPLPGGRALVVENRSGGGGVIALQATAAAAPDGNVLCVASGTLMSVAPVLPGLAVPIDLDQTLTPITGLMSVPMLLVARGDAPFNDLPGLIAHARSNRLLVGTSGNGGVPHLLMARIAQEAGLDFDYIPYRGGVPALLDLLGGRIDAYFSLAPESIQQARAGQFKPIAVANLAPLPQLPAVRPVADQLPGYRGSAWYGLVGPAGLPPPVVAFWAELATAALARTATRERFARQIFETVAPSPAAFRAEIAEERQRWGRVIQLAGIRASD